MGFVRRLTAPKKREVRVGVLGKYANLRDAYASIDKAVEHCEAHLGVRVELDWSDTTDVNDANVESSLNDHDAVIVPGGFGTRGVEGKISCVRYCREHGVPYLGICLGFQVAVIEFCRNVLGLSDANSTEFAPGTSAPVISELPEQKRIEGLGGTMRLGAQDVQILPGTLAANLFGSAMGSRAMVHERFRHRYEVDPEFIERIEAAGMIFSGRHPTRPIMQFLELKREGAGQTHPFFIGAQFHPELTSRPLRPQPMFMGLVAAAIQRKYGTNVDLNDPWAPELKRWMMSGQERPQPV